MGMTGSLILAADVEIAPVASLSARMRARLGARRGEFAVTRPRGRAPAKLVSAAAAALLAEFREARSVADALRRAAGPGGNAAGLLDDAFPLLRDCFNARFLVTAGSPEAARILPSRDRGDAIGPFEVLRCLRVLEDSELYQVRDTNGAVAAVKLVRRHAPATTTGSLAREAAVLERLGGDGAPKLLARGRHRYRPWLAMTWQHGVAPDVAFAELRERGSDADRAVLGLSARIAAAYGRLHRAGVLHGDVHPGNLLVGRSGDVTLLDFGLARPLGQVSLAGRSHAGGVATYFSPEQAAAVLAGRPLPRPTAASEQYAVAALLYRLVTGAYPVEPVPDREGLLRRVVDAPPRPFSRAGAAPWPELENVLARALAKSPDDRHASMAAFAGALRGVAVRRGRAASVGGRAKRAGADVVAGFIERVGLDSPALAAPGPAPTCSVMLGRSGVACALLRISCTRNDADLLALADVWLTRVERDMEEPRAFEAPDQGLLLDHLGAASPFHGPPGVHMVRALVAFAMDDDSAASAAARRFAEASLAPSSGTDLTMGQAGILMATTRLLEAMPRTRPKARAALRGLGDTVSDRLWDTLAARGPAGRSPEPDNPGIAHGWAGILHATLGWCAASSRALPKGFRRRVDELAAAAEPLGRGVRWVQPDASPAPSVWASHEVAGWCNGPAGFTHLWLAVHSRWRQPRHLALAEACGWSAWEGRSTAADLCCGHTGRAYAQLSLYRHTGDASWLERARCLADAAAAAFERTRDDLDRPLSLFKGEAGLAVLVADLERPETAAFPLFESDEWTTAEDD